MFEGFKAESEELSKALFFLDELFSVQGKQMYEIDNSSYVRWNKVRNCALQYMRDNSLDYVVGDLKSIPVDEHWVYRAVLYIESIKRQIFDRTTLIEWNKIKPSFDTWLKYYPIFKKH